MFDMYCKNTKLFITKLFRHCNYGKRATKKPLTAVSGFFVSINIRIDYPKLSYIILLPLIFNELRLSGDGIARKRRFGPTPVDHFVDANEMVLQACEPLLARLGIKPDDYCNHYSEERCKCHYCVDHTLICLKF